MICNCRIVPAMQMALQVCAGGGVADGIPLCFATVGSFPQCLEGFEWFGGRAEDVIRLCFARDCC